MLGTNLGDTGTQGHMLGRSRCVQHETLASNLTDTFDGTLTIGQIPQEDEKNQRHSIFIAEIIAILT